MPVRADSPFVENVSDASKHGSTSDSDDSISGYDSDNPSAISSDLSDAQIYASMARVRACNCRECTPQQSDSDDAHITDSDGNEDDDEHLSSSVSSFSSEYSSSEYQSDVSTNDDHSDDYENMEFDDNSNGQPAHSSPNGTF